MKGNATEGNKVQPNAKHIILSVMVMTKVEAETGTDTNDYDTLQFGKPFRVGVLKPVK